MTPLLLTREPFPGANTKGKTSSQINEGSSDDPAWPWKVIKLNEEYFKGYEGLDFLGTDMPFYLIHAGGDLYREIGSLPGQAALQNQILLGRETTWKVPSASNGPNLSRIESSLFQSIQNTSKFSSMAKEGFSPQMDDLNASAYALLRPNSLGLPSSKSSTPYSNLGIKGLASRSVVTKHSPESLENIIKSPMKEMSNCAPGILRRPLKVVVKLSEKSFLPPFFHAEEERLDVCINIFYNGQFSHSQVVAHGPWSAGEHARMLHCSGRRIGTSCEVPWVLDLSQHDVKSHFMMTPLKRWQKLGEMLMAEANEWEIDERGQRCPTGDYLVLLSKKPIPADLKAPVNLGGGRFGVIDVVVVVGRSSSSKLAVPLSSPRRKNPSKSIVERCLPIISQRNVIAMPLVPSKASAPHPGRPKVIPQKRYRGSELQLGVAQPGNRQKAFESEDTPTALRTRSRSSTTPFDEIPMNSRRRKANQINRVTDNRNELLSKEQTKDVPLTPKKSWHTRASTTPKSSSPSKKKRPVNYNPKYSNRPQNLRRKNSAGEWETPTKDGWVVETWTKSARALKTKLQADVNNLTQPLDSVFIKSNVQQAATEPITEKPVCITKDDPIFFRASQEPTSRILEASDASGRNNGKEVTSKLVGGEKRTNENAIGAEKMDVPHVESLPKVFRIKFFQSSKRAKGESDFSSTDGITRRAKRSSSPEYIRSSGRSEIEGDSGHAVAALRNPGLISDLSSSETFEARSGLVIPTHVSNLLQSIQISNSEQKTSELFQSQDTPVERVTSIPLEENFASNRNREHEAEDSDNSLMETVFNNFLPATSEDITLIKPLGLTSNCSVGQTGTANSSTSLQSEAISTPLKSAALRDDSSTSFQLPVQCNKARQSRRMGASELKALLEPITKDQITNSPFNPGPQSKVTQRRTRESRRATSTTRAVRSTLDTIAVVNEPDFMNSKSIVKPVAKIKTIPKINSAINMVAQEPLGASKVTAVPKYKMDGLDIGGELSECANQREFDPDLATGGSKSRSPSQKSHNGKSSMLSKFNSLNPSPKPSIDLETFISNANSKNAKQPTKKVSKDPTTPTTITQITKDENINTTDITVHSRASNDVVNTRVNSRALITDRKARKIKKPFSRLKKNQDTIAKDKFPEVKISSEVEFREDSLFQDEFVEPLPSNQLPNLKSPAQEINEPRLRNLQSSSKFATVMGVDNSQAILDSMSSSNLVVTKKPVIKGTENTPTVRSKSSNKVIEVNPKQKEGDLTFALKEIGKAKSEIDKAAEGLESLTTQTHARIFAVKSFRPRDACHQVTKSKTGHETDKKSEVSEGINTFKPLTVKSTSNPWKPSPLCDGSVLTYADSVEWVDFKRDSVTGLIHRPMRQETNGSFKETGVLMGVRFVIGI